MNRSMKLSFYFFIIFLIILIIIKSLIFVDGYNLNVNLYATNNFFYILFKIILFLGMLIITLPVFLDKNIKINHIDSTQKKIGIINLIYGISFIFDSLLDLIDITSKVNNSLFDFCLIIFEIISGIGILIYGLLIIFKKESKSSITLLLLPLIYYIIIILKQFIYTQIKTYFDDGIFLILRDLCILMFLISLIKNVFGNGTINNYKFIITFGLMGALLNIVSIFNGNFFAGKYYDAINYVGISNIVFVFYILTYVIQYIFKNNCIKIEDSIDAYPYISKEYEICNDLNNIKKDIINQKSFDNFEQFNEKICENKLLDNNEVKIKIASLKKEILGIELNINKLIENSSENKQKVGEYIDANELNERINSLIDYFS